MELRVLHAILCFLFGRERQNWAFSQLEIRVWCRIRAGNDGRCSFNERPSKKSKEFKKKGKTDTGHVNHHWPHPLNSVQICVEIPHPLIRFPPGNEMEMHIFLFYTTKNQAFDHNLILICSHTKGHCPMQSQTFSRYLIAIKNILHQDIKYKMTTYTASKRTYNHFDSH